MVLTQGGVGGGRCGIWSCSRVKCEVAAHEWTKVENDVYCSYKRTRPVELCMLEGGRRSKIPVRRKYIPLQAAGTICANDSGVHEHRCERTSCGPGRLAFSTEAL